MELQALLESNYEKEPSDECRERVMVYMADADSIMSESMDFKRLFVAVANKVLETSKDVPVETEEKLFNFCEEGLEQLVGQTPQAELTPTLELAKAQFHFFGYAIGAASRIFNIHHEKMRAGDESETTRAKSLYWVSVAFAAARMADESIQMYYDVMAQMTEEEYAAAGIEKISDDYEARTQQYSGELAYQLYALTDEKRWLKWAKGFHEIAGQLYEGINDNKAASQYNNAGECAIRMRKPDRAMELFEKGLRLSTDDELTGLIAYKLGNLSWNMHKASRRNRHLAADALRHYEIYLVKTDERIVDENIRERVASLRKDLSRRKNKVKPKAPGSKRKRNKRKK